MAREVGSRAREMFMIQQPPVPVPVWWEDASDDSGRRQCHLPHLYATNATQHTPLRSVPAHPDHSVSSAPVPGSGWLLRAAGTGSLRPRPGLSAGPRPPTRLTHRSGAGSSLSPCPLALQSVVLEICHKALATSMFMFGVVFRHCPLELSSPRTAATTFVVSIPASRS